MFEKDTPRNIANSLVLLNSEKAHPQTNKKKHLCYLALKNNPKHCKDILVLHRYQKDTPRSHWTINVFNEKPLENHWFHYCSPPKKTNPVVTLTNSSFSQSQNPFCYHKLFYYGFCVFGFTLCSCLSTPRHNRKSVFVL